MSGSGEEEGQVIDFEMVDEKKRGDDVFEDFISSMKDDTSLYVNVSREITGYRDKVFLDKFPIDMYEYGDLLKHIRDSYGSGNYRIQVYGPGGLQKGGNKLVRIEAPMKEKLESVPGAENNQMLALVMQQMEDMNNKFMAVLSSQRNDEDAEMKFLEKMKTYRDVFGYGGNGGAAAPAQNQSGVDGLIETLGQVEKLKGLLGNDQESAEPGFGKLGEMASTLITKAIESKPQEVPANVAPLGRRPLGAQRLRNPIDKPVMPTPEQDQAIKQEIENREVKKGDDQEMNMLLNMGLSELLRRANIGEDPGDCVDMIFNAIDEDKIKAFLLEEGALDRLFAMKPEMVDVKDWVMDLVEHVKACFHMESKFEQEYPDHPNYKGEDVIVPIRPENVDPDIVRPVSTSEIRQTVGDEMVISGEGDLTESEAGANIAEDNPSEASEKDDTESAK